MPMDVIMVAVEKRKAAKLFQMSRDNTITSGKTVVSKRKQQ